MLAIILTDWTFCKCSLATFKFWNVKHFLFISSTARHTGKYQCLFAIQVLEMTKSRADILDTGSDCTSVHRYATENLPMPISIYRISAEMENGDVQQLYHFANCSKYLKPYLNLNIASQETLSRKFIHSAMPILQIL